MTQSFSEGDTSFGRLLAYLRANFSDQYARGKAFENVSKWFLQNDSYYGRELSQVWLWDEWPGRWGPDIGIDIVATSHDGSIWAIQSKCYSGSVPSGEIDSFIAASARPEFDRRLLISSGEITKHSHTKLTNNDKPSSFLLYEQLDERNLNWMAYLDQSIPPLTESKTPYPHQDTVIKDVLQGFESHDRGKVIMACGTGKTLVGLWVAERLACERTLVLDPSLALVSQVSREWLANATESFSVLYVCSDETVDPDSFVAKTAEMGVRTTNDPSEIAGFLQQPGRRVVFSTYQSSPKIQQAQAMGCPSFDLIIADEAHHCAGRVTSPFATPLDEGKLHGSKRLFMTATPRLYTVRVKSGMGGGNDLDNVYSMDDEETFGPDFHVLTFGEAIAGDLLSDYRVAVIGVTQKEIANLINNRTIVNLEGTDDKRDAESLGAIIALLKATQEHNLTHVITFHNRIKRASDFSKALTKSNVALGVQGWFKHVAGEMPTGERNTILRQFRNLKDGVGVLSNARCLGEGVDVRAIDGVAFIDPKRSKLDIVQAVGRAIRKGNEEKIATIIIPVMVDEADGEDPRAALESGRYNVIWEVLLALRAHDDIMAEEIDGLRERLGRHSLIGQWSEGSKIDLAIDVGEDFIRALETRIVESTSDSWWFWLGLLQKYADREGHARVPQSHKEDGFNLGMWVSTQRVNEATLSPERIARLEAIQGWVWDPFAAQLEEAFISLQKYADREGHARVPSSHKEDGFNLGMWVSHQRSDKATLSPERIARLEAIQGWVWDPFAAQLEEAFISLQKYADREGHARVPQSHKEDGFNLGKWVSTQRVNKATLTPERIARLEAILGWVWDGRR